MKSLLNTDIGTVIDDAVCLAYLLAPPRRELPGITAVTREAEKRAALASVRCRLAGQDAPTIPGAESSLQGPQLALRAQQAAVLPRRPHQTRFP